MKDYVILDDEVNIFVVTSPSGPAPYCLYVLLHDAVSGLHTTLYNPVGNS
jgi:hypothetical protein